MRVLFVILFLIRKGFGGVYFLGGRGNEERERGAASRALLE